MNRSAGHRPGAFIDNVHPPTFLVFFALRAAIYRNVEKEMITQSLSAFIPAHSSAAESSGKKLTAR
jgi:hypothetical protein